ncbi:MAG: c-type cytochrome [Verrucomicrobia bacterium]|nr:c-type cytochrome [Verrucomicrobiota bacterium]
MFRLLIRAVGFCVLIGCAHAAEFPKIYDSQSTNDLPLTPAAEALKRIKLPPGFNATLFAAEPDVQNPIAMAWDARGRLWIAENYTYAEAKVGFDHSLRDRILIFEDTDGDGRFDKRTVFWDGAELLTSIEIGFGGVFALCPQKLLFIPDRNGDDRPDGEPQVLLDGFDAGRVRHNIANGLKWGPDGWLYGRHGIITTSALGPPGTPESERVKINCGIWRYHPTRHVVEDVVHGTTNPWGMDWDAHGEPFFINTVINHLFHVIPGAHYRRMSGEGLDPHTYAFMEAAADHFHWDTREKWSDIRTNFSDTTSLAGGGHAHSGLMIYHGDNWPEKYRGALFTVNLHGHRLNMDTLHRAGSGYVGKHAPDFMTSGDPWFRAVDLGSGPDGGVYVLDWSDIGECHENDGVHRTSGRIFKITYGTPARPAVADVSKLSEAQLVALLGHQNEWFARQARQQLQQRAALGAGPSPHDELRQMFSTSPDSIGRLRALWALNAVGTADANFLRAQLAQKDEYVRAWAIRLLVDEPKKLDAATPGAFARLALTEKSALVRVALASALQRVPVASRAAIATPLLARADDANDHNLPLMLWYGIKGVAEADASGFARLAERCEIPPVRRFIARRLAEDIEQAPAPLNELLKFATARKNLSFSTDIIDGLADGLRGVRKAAKPAAWDALQLQLAKSAGAALRDRVRELSVLFGDGRALDEIRALALDDAADVAQRRAALQTLIENRPPDLREVCERMMAVRDLAAVAARGLTLFDDPRAGEFIAKRYHNLLSHLKPDVLASLVSRPTFAKALLAQVGDGANQIPRADISAFHARQIRSFNDPALNRKLAEVWGEVRDSAADKQQLIAKWKPRLTPAALAKADRSQGRAVFNTVCATCHKLYGDGGIIGPDLTGAGRDNLDYLLENLADPSAIVPADFRMSVVNLKDGRTLNGLLGAKTDRTLVIQTMTEKLTVERAEVQSVQESQLSLMPEGLLEALSETQVRDLIAYLIVREQAPLPAGQ